MLTKPSIREKLHNFIDTAEEKKIEAIYTILEDEIEQNESEYTDEFKAELDSGYEYYKNGGKMVTPEEADERINHILSSNKK